MEVRERSQRSNHNRYRVGICPLLKYVAEMPFFLQVSLVMAGIVAGGKEAEVERDLYYWAFEEETFLVLTLLLLHLLSSLPMLYASSRPCRAIYQLIGHDG